MQHLKTTASLVLLCCLPAFSQRSQVTTLSGTVAALPPTCTQNDWYYATNATGGANLYFCTSTNTWTVASGGGANTALSNLAAVSINTSLLAQTGVDLGSTTKPFRDLFLWGSGTFGTTSIRQTGTPTAARTITWQDASGTPAYIASPTFTGTVTDSATLGSEEQPTLATGYTCGAGWVCSGVVADKTSNGTGTVTGTAPTAIVAGTTYCVTFILSAATVGSFTYTIGGTPGFTTYSVAQTYPTECVKATTTAKLIITPTNTSRLTISSISVKAITTPGNLSIQGTIQVSGTGQWSGNQLLSNGTTWRGMTATGTTSDILGVNTSNVLVLGTVTGGETPLTLQMYGGSSASAGLVMFANAVRAYNLATVSTPNSTLATAVGCANSVVTDTFNIACLGANNNTTVAIRAGGNDASSSPLLAVRLNDNTTNTFQVARDGYALKYNNTTVAGTGMTHIVGSVASTGQTSSIGTTNIQCTIAGSAGVCPAGLYKISVYTDITATGTGTLTSTIAWSDPAAARTITSTGIATTATNFEQVEYRIRTDGVANITYATTLTVSGTYAIYVTAERLQ